MAALPMKSFEPNSWQHKFSGTQPIPYGPMTNMAHNYVPYEEGGDGPKRRLGGQHLVSHGIVGSAYPYADAGVTVDESPMPMPSVYDHYSAGQLSYARGGKNLFASSNAELDLYAHSPYTTPMLNAPQELKQNPFYVEHTNLSALRDSTASRRHELCSAPMYRNFTDPHWLPVRLGPPSPEMLYGTMTAVNPLPYRHMDWFRM
jgi:hypothetical protein